MSLIRTLQRSSQCAPALDLTVNPGLSFLYPFLPSVEAHSCPPSLPQPENAKPPSPLTPIHSSRFRPNTADNGFIPALVRASTCRRHRAKLPLSKLEPRSSTRTLHSFPHSVRRYSSASVPSTIPQYEHIREPIRDPTLEETIYDLKRIVLIYDIDPEDYELVPHVRSKRLSGIRPIADRMGDSPGSDGCQLLTDLLDDPHTTHDEVFEAFQFLVDQCGVEIPRDIIDKLLKKLSRVHREDDVEVMRYFTVLDYLKSRNLPLAPVQWDNAMRFASRANRGRNESGLDTAMYLWKQMEEDACVTASFSTFNILIHGAMLRQRWALVDKLIEEMERRKHRFDRYFQHTRITYYGLRYGPSAVRAAYNQFVDSGYVVATDVLNTVIRSFIVSGEISAAEHVLGKMKVMAAKHPTAGLFPWRHQSSRRFFQKLNDYGTLDGYLPAKKALIQNGTPIGPNLHTYSILIKGHAVDHGNMDRSLQLLYEMKGRGIHPNVAIFYNMVNGFLLHGHKVNSGWTADRLEALWLGFFRSADSKRFDDLDMSGFLTYVLVAAFHKCAGRKRAMEVLHDVQARWAVDESILDMIAKYMNA